MASTPTRSVLGAIAGTIHGGQQPVQGAHIYVFQMGTSGYGTASQSLLTNIPGVTYPDTTTIPGHTIYYVTSGPAASGGAFSVTGDYTCTAGTQVYLLALGGSPDAGADTNSGIGLMAGLGTCPPTGGTLAQQVPYVTVNEVSTVVTAYALAGFAVDAEHISSDAGVSTNPTAALAAHGAANAMANVANIVDVATGTALTYTAGSNNKGLVPQTTINTLANILAACINTPASTSSDCATLFSAATADGTTAGAQPAETATAAINIAHFPGANVSTLYGLVGATPPFAGSLSAQPNDWTIGLQYFGQGLSNPGAIAVDGMGNIWVANRGAKSLIELSALGTALSGLTNSSGYTGGGLSYGVSIAIDRTGNAWVANEGSSTVSEFSPSGTAVSASGYSGGGLSSPISLAIDGVGNVWVANQGNNTVSEFSSSGTALSASGYGGGGLSNPWFIAIDGAGSAWVANEGNDSVSKFSSSGTAMSGSGGYTGGGLDDPLSIAIDGSGNAWVPNFGNESDSVSEFSSSGRALSGSSGYSGGGLLAPESIAFDGAGNAWMNNLLNSVSELSPSGTAISGIGGYTHAAAGTDRPQGIAIDSSGDVWAVDTGRNSITEVLGAATPVITPICAGLPTTPSADGSSNLASRP